PGAPDRPPPLRGGAARARGLPITPHSIEWARRQGANAAIRSTVVLGAIVVFGPDVFSVGKRCRASNFDAS
ncbi:hypothetical protein, partial [Nocardia sp. NPDC057440]|uniref:hypothetical protein n=1 Tax=Nocardia sp. NPDC057440 TaxID=3346134 RepID=UPI00366D218C